MSHSATLARSPLLSQIKALEAGRKRASLALASSHCTLARVRSICAEVLPPFGAAGLGNAPLSEPV